jgi:hypothetical protein
MLAGRFKDARLVLAFLGRLWARSLHLRRFLEELHQPINQSSAAADHVQSALVLMFFQNLIEMGF